MRSKQATRRTFRQTMPWVRSYLGLEMNEQSIKLVRATVDRSRRVHLRGHWIQTLPEGCIEDGVIRDERRLIDVLRKTVADHRLQRMKVHCTLPGQKVLIRRLQFPDLPRRKLRELIEFEINQMKLLPFDQPYYDFASWTVPPDDTTRHASGLQDQQTKPASPMCDVLIAAAPADAVDPYVSIVQEAGLRPVSIECKAISLYRAVEAAQLIDPESAFAVIDLQHRSVDLSIYYRGQLMAMHNAPLQFVPGRFPYDCEELAKELDRLVSYFRYVLHHRDQKLEHIIVSGDAPRIEEVVHYLRGRFAQDAQLLYDAELAAPAGLDEMQFAAMAVSIGLALRGSAV